MVRRVLIADDHDDGRQALANLLTIKGYQVEEAATGEDAIRIASWFSPDVAIVDLFLPEMNGFAVAKTLSIARLERPYLIAVTGYTGDDTRQRARDAGFDYFALKPWSTDEMLDLLRAPETARRSKSA
jgi:two-component system CheB/CheR fusion protein